MYITHTLIEKMYEDIALTMAVISESKIIMFLFA